MTCGINLGFLLICFQALHVCYSLALHQGEGSWTRNRNSPVDLWHVHGSFGGGRPQDEFRQAYVVKGSSPDTGAQKGLDGEQYAASQASHNPSVQYYLSSLAKPRWHKVDSSNGEVPPGQSSSVAGSSASDSNPQKGLVLTLPHQQGTQRTGQYAQSKPDVRGPKASSHQPSARKPHGTGKVHQKPGLDTSAQLTGLNEKGGFNPPKEFIKATSGLSRGRKVYPKGSPTKLSSSTSHLNPVVSNIRERYELPIYHHFGLHQSQQVSAYNQNPQLVALQTGSSLASVPLTGHKLRLSPGQQLAPTIVHRIPWPYGGFAIKRLEDEDPMEQTTTTKMPKKPVTRKPTKTYTFPPRYTESFRPRRPLVHKKSKWMRVKSNQLKGFPGVLVSTL